MKNAAKALVALLTATALLLTFISCVKKENVQEKTTDLWENALYTEDTSLGSGEKTVIVKVVAEGKTVLFTINTDADILGDSLLNNNLISGENGDYGIYIKSVNGILADYDKDKSYWAFYINGEYALSGVDRTEINAGDEYMLKYEK